MYNLKNDEKMARERLQAFWHGESLGRPALSVVVDPGIPIEIPQKFGRYNQKENENNLEWQEWYNEKRLYGKTFLAEAMPSVLLEWGSHISLLAVLTGGDFEYHGSAWIKPVENIYSNDLPVFDSNHKVVKYMEKGLLNLHNRFGEMALINPPALLDGLTTLSLLRNTENLCIDLLDDPKNVKKWNNSLTSLYIDTYEHFYNFVKQLGHGDTTTWLSATAEGKYEAVQCDFAVTMSCTMYEEFVMPNLCKKIEYLDYSLYHLDGTCQMRFIDQLASIPKLNGIQWNPENFNDHPAKWIDALKTIRKKNLSLYIHCNNVEEAVYLTKELGPDGLMIDFPSFLTENEAYDAIDRIEHVKL